MGGFSLFALLGSLLSEVIYGPTIVHLRTPEVFCLLAFVSLLSFARKGTINHVQKNKPFKFANAYYLVYQISYEVVIGKLFWKMNAFSNFSWEKVLSDFLFAKMFLWAFDDDKEVMKGVLFSFTGML